MIVVVFPQWFVSLESVLDCLFSSKSNQNDIMLEFWRHTHHMATIALIEAAREWDELKI